MYCAPISSRPCSSAGAVKKAAAVIGTLLLGTGSVYGFERSEHWQQYLQPRVPFVLDEVGSDNDEVLSVDIRNAAEHIENIRRVLNPAVADLAALFDVSRQTIYKWLAGSEPESDKLKRVVQLSYIADAFSEAEISRSGALLKMKAFDGRSLMDLIKSGDDTSDYVESLIVEAKAMEASYVSSGLADTKSRATGGWLSSISIPGSSERS